MHQIDGLNRQDLIEKVKKSCHHPFSEIVDFYNVSHHELVWFVVVPSVVPVFDVVQSLFQLIALPSYAVIAELVLNVSAFGAELRLTL